MLHIVQAYTDAEVHSIKGSPSDVADIGVFSDNADKTIFEFLESFELGYIDWGNNRQRASKLSIHLSDDLKDKLMTRSDSYALMREWLVQNYGGAARILNEIQTGTRLVFLIPRSKCTSEPHTYLGSGGTDWFGLDKEVNSAQISDKSYLLNFDVTESIPTQEIS